MFNCYTLFCVSNRMTKFVGQIRRGNSGGSILSSCLKLKPFADLFGLSALQVRIYCMYQLIKEKFQFFPIYKITPLSTFQTE